MAVGAELSSAYIRPSESAPSLVADTLTQPRNDLFLTRDIHAVQCLQHQMWGHFRARALEIQDQHCTPDRLLGSGGASRVYRSMYRGAPCAMKQLAAVMARLPTSSLTQVLSEMLLLQRVQHENIVQCRGFFLWDVDYAATQPCILLELMDHSVDELLKMKSPSLRTLQSRVKVMQHVADGLSHLHGMGVIHRDVKPGNILVKFAAGGSRDFVAKVDSPSIHCCCCSWWFVHIDDLRKQKATTYS